MSSQFGSVAAGGGGGSVQFNFGNTMMMHNSSTTSTLYHNTNDYPAPEYSPDQHWSYPSWFFSLARFNLGGPTYYGQNVHMQANMYLGRTVMGIIAAGLTFLLVLCVILPIIKHRIESVIVAVNSVCIGAAISLCMVSPEWLYGNVHIISPMNYYQPNQEYAMSLGVHIGLSSANITLETILPPQPTQHQQQLLKNISSATNNTTTSLSHQHEYFFYNERIKMYTPEMLTPVLDTALESGYPIPLLTIYHFLSSANLGFSWSQDILEAGYHCYLSTIFALTNWFLTLVFIAAIPRYSCYSFICIGCFLLFTNITYFYWVRLHAHFPPIYISGEVVRLRYGACYWTCLVTGLWSIMYGFTFAIYDVIYPDRFLSIFDIDFDSKCSLAAAHRLNKNSSTMSLDELNEDDDDESSEEEYHFEL